MIAIVENKTEAKEFAEILSGEVPQNVEEIICNRAVLLKGRYPRFVEIAMKTWQTQRNNFNMEPEVLPVKVVVKNGFPGVSEPGLLIERSVLAIRGTLGEAGDFIHDMVRDDPFYCEINA